MKYTRKDIIYSNVKIKWKASNKSKTGSLLTTAE